MNKHNVPGAVSQSIIIRLSTNENVWFIEIWYKLNLQFGNDTSFSKNGRGEGDSV